MENYISSERNNCISTIKKIDRATCFCSKRTISIDFFRFFFMVLICLWHFSNNIRLVYHGYIGVEFFFILSGVFLFQTYCAHPELNSQNYLTNRFARFFPKYIFCLIPIFTLVNYQWIKEIDINSITDIILRFVAEGLMLQGFGIFPGCSNYPTWYLSVLLFGGGIIFSFLKISRKRSLYIFFPIFAILSYMFIFSDGKSCIERWGFQNGVYIPFIRGMADICLGVLFMAIISYNRNFLEKKAKALNCISCISFFLLILIITIEPSHDQYCLFLIPFTLIGCFMKNSLLNQIFIHPIWSELGNISYEMFLIHAFIIKMYAHTIMPIISSSILIIAIYMTIVTITAYLIHLLFKIVWGR